ncbi:MULTISPECIES: hypothetical protein [unclassified Rhizobium]|uniref:hypothetical protein n=1 Tax=unclassified Rhizobium TaxID=2613769 RepID=UPI000ABB15E5|nr:MULTISPECIES: hypothetical protein [unclassified Rhizobium]
MALKASLIALASALACSIVIKVALCRTWYTTTAKVKARNRDIATALTASNFIATDDLRGAAFILG